MILLKNGLNAAYLPSYIATLVVDDFQKFLKQAAGTAGVLSYGAFIEHALYHEEHGYYRRRDRTRVAHAANADFYTSESLGTVFSQLVLEAASQLLHPHKPEEFTFLEIGAEPGQSVASEAEGRFAQSRVLKRGESIPTDAPIVVFCNELFDAQPFYRVVFDGRQWRELGVKVSDEGLTEIFLETPTGAVQEVLQELPVSEPGYRIDLPLGAEGLMKDLTKPDWNGLLIAFDYGLDWEDLVRRRPAGTARTYYKQSLGTDLLERPGDQDITCHICWDRLEAVLGKSGFCDVKLERQEAFFIRRASPAISRIMQEGDLKAQSTLRELIHPMRMGAAFQVLTARRGV